MRSARLPVKFPREVRLVSLFDGLAASGEGGARFAHGHNGFEEPPPVDIIRSILGVSPAKDIMSKWCGFAPASSMAASIGAGRKRRVARLLQSDMQPQASARTHDESGYHCDGVVLLQILALRCADEARHMDEPVIRIS